MNQLKRALLWAFLATPLALVPYLIHSLCQFAALFPAESRSLEKTNA